jgi:hypothetical protein
MVIALTSAPFLPADHTCATCRRFTDTGDVVGHCSRYDCTTPAEFLDEWGYCWEGKKEEEDG